MSPPAACPCTSAASVTVEWECRNGHRGYAALCRDHGAIHVAALMSEDIRCGQCRREGTETVCVLRRVNGKAVSSRYGRQVLLKVGKLIFSAPRPADAEIDSLRARVAQLEALVGQLIMRVNELEGKHAAETDAWWAG